MRGFGAPQREPVFKSKTIPVLANFGVAEGWVAAFALRPREFTREAQRINSVFPCKPIQTVEQRIPARGV